MDASEIIDQVQTEMGLDAYHIYPDSRRFIPETVLWGIAAACVIEFIKGIIDFKSLGEQARGKLDELVTRWKKKEDFERFVTDKELKSIVAKAIDKLPAKMTDADEAQARDRLAKALLEFGLPADAANSKAASISVLLLELVGD